MVNGSIAVQLITVQLITVQLITVQINNVACSRLGNMLHLEIKRGRRLQRHKNFNMKLEGLQRAQIN